MANTRPISGKGQPYSRISYRNDDPDVNREPPAAPPTTLPFQPDSARPSPTRHTCSRAGGPSVAGGHRRNASGGEFGSGTGGERCGRGNGRAGTSVPEGPCEAREGRDRPDRLLVDRDPGRLKDPGVVRRAEPAWGHAPEDASAPDWGHLVECDLVRPVIWRSRNTGRRDGQMDGVLYVVTANTIVTICRKMKSKNRREVTWSAQAGNRKALGRSSYSNSMAPCVAES